MKVSEAQLVYSGVTLRSRVGRSQWQVVEMETIGGSGRSCLDIMEVPVAQFHPNGLFHYSCEATLYNCLAWYFFSFHSKPKYFSRVEKCETCLVFSPLCFDLSRTLHFLSLLNYDPLDNVCRQPKVLSTTSTTAPALRDQVNLFLSLPSLPPGVIISIKFTDHNIIV